MSIHISPRISVHEILAECQKETFAFLNSWNLCMGELLKGHKLAFRTVIHINCYNKNVLYIWGTNIKFHHIFNILHASHLKKLRKLRYLFRQGYSIVHNNNKIRNNLNAHQQQIIIGNHVFKIIFLQHIPLPSKKEKKFIYQKTKLYICVYMFSVSIYCRVICATASCLRMEKYDKCLMMVTSMEQKDKSRCTEAFLYMQLLSK